MQLHTLTFRAIGPFDGEHTIDFDRLGASGLFLLEGPTGSGKSTIIDAIVFALYGGLAGEEASKQRLHSHHARAGVEPFVDLTFSTQAGDFRIRRSPAHERPKRTGTGTTMQNESAKLSRLGSLDAPDRGEEISTRAQEIGNEIKEIVGLDKQQFLQTVVLPQGEFAKFLRSTGEDRKDLLRTIFRTDVYESVTDQLKAMRIQAGKSIDEAKARVAEAFAAFSAASQHEFEEGLDEGDFEGLEEASVAAAASLTASASAAREDNAKSQSILARAEKSHGEQKSLAESLSARAELLTRQSQLAEQAEGVDGLKDRIQEAQRAATVSMSINGLRKATDQFEKAAGVLASAQTRHGTAEGLSKADLMAERDDISTEITELGRLLAVESALPERRLELDNGIRKREALSEHIEDLRDAVAAAPRAIATLEKRHSKLQMITQSLPDLTEKVARAAKAARATEVVKATTLLLSQAMANRDGLVAKATKANEGVRHLRQRKLDEYAGVLSQRLEDGHPCAVCGSEKHPAPAQLQEDHPADSDIEAAEHELDQLTAQAASAADDVNKHKEELARRYEQADGLDAHQAKIALDAALAQEAEAREAERQLTAAQRALDEAKTRLTNDDTQLTQAKVDLALADADLVSLAKAIDEDSARITESVRGRADKLAHLVAGMRERRELIDRVIVAREAHAAASSAVGGRQKEVDEALEVHDFDSIEEAEGAALDERELQTITNQVKEYDRHCALVADRLSIPEIAGLTGEETTDVGSAAHFLSESQLAARESQKLADVLAARESSTARALSTLKAALKVHKGAVSESGAIVRLAGVAEGSHPANVKKVSLGTYVLMRRFDDVVAAANVRLAPMSNGRYQLVRIEENEGKGGGRRTGLALAVQDGETGRQREPRTLSGGETFNASLCLALGLADVVTGEAGGIELGTLFVDEGFGSLDGEALDRVMAELGKLSRGGRMIGIVSHVEELKLRVAERIEVRRKAEGPSTLLVKAEGDELPELAV